MSVRLSDTDHICCYDSVTEQAFGPVEVCRAVEAAVSKPAN